MEKILYLDIFSGRMLVDQPHHILRWSPEPGVITNVLVSHNLNKKYLHDFASSQPCIYTDFVCPEAWTTIQD